MDFKELCSLRFSARGYTSDDITDQQLSYILECARLSPSAVNRQPWHFYVVKSPDMKAELHRCYNREWFTSAPLYIVCCIRHDEAWVRPSDHKEHGDIDIAIAAEHICLAAAAIGLGSCWVCNFDASLCKEILQLPAEEEPAVIVPIGHTSPNCPQKEKVRKPLSEIVTYR